jgi:uncharacterized damage-inducible protein DinB
MDSLVAHFQLMARYNSLANQALYGACVRLDEVELKRRRPAFFRSIYGTLNHILVADRIWLDRFSGKVVPPMNLDTILYANLDELQTARGMEDQRIIEFTQQLLNPEFLNCRIPYTNSAGDNYEDVGSVLLAHFFNHQTHHRGQIHDMLIQTPITPPSLDLHRLINP